MRLRRRETGALDRLADPLYSWQDTAASVVLDAVFRQRLILFRGEEREDETVSQTHVGALARGTAGDRFGFRVRHFEAREWSTLPRRTRADILARPIELAQIKGKAVDFREATFQLIWATRWFDVSAGKGSLDWGPGRTGNLFLTAFAPSFGILAVQCAVPPSAFQTHSGIPGGGAGHGRHVPDPDR